MKQARQLRKSLYPKANKQDIDCYIRFCREDVIQNGKVIMFNDVMPDYIKPIVEKREKARRKKDFETADRLRTYLEKRGYIVDDSADAEKSMVYMDDAYLWE